MNGIDGIIEQVKSYNPRADVELIRKAYEFAAKAHEGQLRLTGDPYISHPLEAARLLVELEMDATSIAAGLLHDVVEDSRVTVDQLKTEFNPEVARLVDGVTKLKLTDFEIEPKDAEKPPDAPKKRHAESKRSAENLRKIFLAMARDLRVLVIKLADRLHNLMTLSALPPDRQRKVAMETLQIYAPLAHRLGIWKIKWQLEDLAFKYLEPEAYETVAEKVARTRSEREQDLKEAGDLIKTRLEEAGIDGTIQARPKHLYSIYQKMLKQEIHFQEIYDLSAVRIIVNSVADCYYALGIVHDLWMPIPDRFTDHIAKSKSNMYQSLHTKVVGPRGEPLEIQIRTWEMHRMAEFGIAAHWQYKEGGRSGDEFERKLSWLRQQLFDWQAETDDANEFLKSVTSDLFTDQVFIFTPKGDVIDLPAGSTPVDFAYRIHSDLGSKCVGAKVNGRIVPLTYRFNNGDIVEVITRSNSQPSLDWLNFVKTSHAKNKIKNHFRKLHYQESMTKGREMLEREMERLGHEAQLALKPDKLLKIAQAMNVQTEDDLYAAIGYGHVAAATVVNRLKAELPQQDVLFVSNAVKPAGEAKLALSIDGADQMMIKRGRCCAPIPGDEVVGYITRGRGMVLHRQLCPNVANYKSNEGDRLVAVDWSQANGERYPTEIKIEALDRVGLLNDISAIFSEAKININAAKVQSLPNKIARMDLTIDVQDINHLNSLMNSIGRLTDIMRIERVASSSQGRRD